MSRVGKKPIKILPGVKVALNNTVVEVSGKVGKLSKQLPSAISIKVDGDQVTVTNSSSEVAAKALHGLTRTLIQNMVKGVADGYSKELELQGVGYRAQSHPGKLTMQLGFSHPVEFPLPGWDYGYR